MLVREHELDDTEHITPARRLVDMEVADIDGAPVEPVGIDVTAPMLHPQAMALENSAPAHECGQDLLHLNRVWHAPERVENNTPHLCRENWRLHVGLAGDHSLGM